MPDLESEVDALVLRYLMERGCEKSAQVFLEEAGIKQDSDNQKGELVSLITKGVNSMKSTGEDFITIQIALHKIKCEQKASNQTHPIVRKIAYQPELLVQSSKDAMSVTVRLNAGNPGKTHVLFCPNDWLLLTGSRYGSVELWDMSSNSTRLVKQMDHENEITSIDWSPNGLRFATGCSNGLTRVYSKDGLLQSQAKIVDSGINSVRWNGNADYFGVSFKDGRFVIFNNDGTIKHHFFEHQKEAKQVGWLDNNTAVTIGADGMLIVYKIGNLRPISAIQAFESPINCMSINIETSVIATGTDYNCIKLWNLAKMHPLERVDEYRKQVKMIRWKPFETNLFVCSFYDDRSLMAYDNEREATKSLNGHSNTITCFEFSRDGKLMASGSKDGTVIIWSGDESSSIPLKRIGRAGGPKITALSWSSDGNMIAASNRNGTIISFDVQNMRY
ncbi:unnamed protein product [Caenorhabditis angaria]|uniref:Uncharacterized protein n=1 Tax=Caenorhabditis angaria TaxID=860376 RepID=A0A9P1J1C0_9PELO|nr:unnamed protein product [Caenorhabditis angaria]